MMVDIERIKPNPYQPRSTIKEEDLRSLVDSIKTKGIIQPVVVKKKGDEFQLIVGERRFRAAKAAGLKEIPAVVRSANNRDMLETALIENIERKNLDPIEEAVAYKRLIEEFGLTQQHLAETLHKDRTTITNVIRLLNLPGRIREYIKEGKISEGHARALLSLGERPEVLILGERIVREKLSVREVERLARRAAVQRKVKVRDHEVEQMAENLCKRFGAKVEIFWSRSRGRIVFHLYSLAELEKIFSQLMGR